MVNVTFDTNTFDKAARTTMCHSDNSLRLNLRDFLDFLSRFDGPDAVAFLTTAIHAVS
jgi:hypothetical protein